MEDLSLCIGPPQGFDPYLRVPLPKFLSRWIGRGKAWRRSREIKSEEDFVDDTLDLSAYDVPPTLLQPRRTARTRDLSLHFGPSPPSLEDKNVDENHSASELKMVPEVLEPMEPMEPVVVQCVWSKKKETKVDENDVCLICLDVCEVDSPCSSAQEFYGAIQCMKCSKHIHLTCWNTYMKTAQDDRKEFLPKPQCPACRQCPTSWKVCQNEAFQLQFIGSRRCLFCRKDYDAKTKHSAWDCHLRTLECPRCKVSLGCKSENEITRRMALHQEWCESLHNVHLVAAFQALVEASRSETVRVFRL